MPVLVVLTLDAAPRLPLVGSTGVLLAVIAGLGFRAALDLIATRAFTWPLAVLRRAVDSRGLAAVRNSVASHPDS